MKNLTLKQLRYFEALARQGHFGKAADDCAISQPALSMQIRDLEEIMGSPLFERGPREVSLTAFGRAFAERSREILAQVDELADLATTARGKLPGHLRLGVIPTVAPYLLPRLVAELYHAQPSLDLNIRETITPRLIEALFERKLDAAIVALPISEEGLHEEPLFSEDFVLVRPAKDQDLPLPSAEGLQALRLLLLEEGHCFREQALDFCGRNSLQPREVMDASALATLVQMVGAGIGVTLIPEMAVSVETRSAPVSVARFEAPAPSRQLGLVWRHASPLAPKLRAMAEVIRGLSGP